MLLGDFSRAQNWRRRQLRLFRFDFVGKNIPVIGKILFVGQLLLFAADLAIDGRLGFLSEKGIVRVALGCQLPVHRRNAGEAPIGPGDVLISEWMLWKLLLTKLLW